MANELTVEQITAQLETMEKGLSKKAGEAAGVIKTELDEQIKSLKNQLEAVKGLPEGVDISQIQKDLATTIEAIDQMQVRFKDQSMGNQKDFKYFDEAVGEVLSTPEAKEQIEKAFKTTKGSFNFALPGKIKMSQKVDTLSSFYTGDPVATYNQRQAILPSQKVNFRDLVPTAMSPTGLYVTYREDAGGTNNIAVQTEGSAKGDNSYAMTEVKTVNGYIAGTQTFSKQLLKSAPWLQGTLVRMLMRDFYKAENSDFYTTVSGAATGAQSSGSSADDVLQLITQIGAILDDDFNASYAIVNNQLLARLIANTYTQGYYPGAGAVNLTGNGINIFGVPIVGASWATANKALIIDSDYLERVEVEGLNLSFSFEEGNNFTKNLVTARVECFEEINLMLAESAYFIDLGAS